jgi:ribonuclease P protein component
LLRRAEFEAVYRAGRRRASKQFVVFVLPHAASTEVPAAPRQAGAAQGARPARFGVSVKRALGNAVTRNRIRRRIREILRLRREEFSTGWDIVIHPRGSVATAPFAPLAEELAQLIRAAAKERP